MVNCGAEKRDNCNNCPFDLKHENVDNKRDFKGETWCNGDCKWNTGNHSSSKATKNESSCPDEIPLQMLPMCMWGPENMKIKNI